MSRFAAKHIFLPVLVSLVLACAGPAVHAETAPIDNPETRLLEQQKKFHRLKKGITDQRERVKVSRKREFNLLAELEKLDRRIAEERDKLAALADDLDRHEKLLLQKQQESDQALAEKEKFKSHVEKRLDAYYRMGSIGVMNVIFSASSLPDLLNFEEYFGHIIQYDQKVITQYRTKIEQLEEARAALGQEKRRLIEVIAEVKVQETRLAEARQDRLALLQRVRTEKKLYQQALVELEDAAAGLSAKLDQLKKEVESSQQEKIAATRRQRSAKKRRPTAAGPTGFAELKGRLDPPVPGAVTTYFGRNTDERFGITTFANGIDIKTEAGTVIKAVYDGRVVFAGFLRGYGNLLIIDHGGQYYSLISRAAKLFKKEGDPVVKDEAIGVMSDQESLLHDGLHFEIRHGTEPENPLHWLNNAKLKITARKSLRN